MDLCNTGCYSFSDASVYFCFWYSYLIIQMSLYHAPNTVKYKLDTKIILDLSTLMRHEMLPRHPARVKTAMFWFLPINNLNRYYASLVLVKMSEDGNHQTAYHLCQLLRNKESQRMINSPPLLWCKMARQLDVSLPLQPINCLWWRKVHLE